MIGGVGVTDDVTVTVEGFVSGNVPAKLNPPENGEDAAEDIIGNELVGLVVKLV